MFLLLVCIVGIFLISSASATDLNESDVIAENICQDTVNAGECGDAYGNPCEDIAYNRDCENEMISSDGCKDSSVLGDSPYVPSIPDSPPSQITPVNHTFAAIQSAVNSYCPKVILDGTYKMQQGDNPITFSSPIGMEIVGINGATLDGCGIGKLININRGMGIKFKNIIFKNGVSSDGGVISAEFINSYISGRIYTGFATFENCTFINNIASNNGGAICYCTATNCIFIGNSATNNGGAVYDSTVTNCSFIGNSAANGGAIYCGKIINCNFTDNSAAYGGAVFAENNDFVIEDSRFDNNIASDKGGAIYIKKSNNGVINNSCFNSCFATNEGNAVYWAEGSGLTICQSSFENCARRGGSSYLKFTNKASNYNIYDCIFDVPPSDIVYYYTSRLNVENLKVFEGEKGVLVANLSNIFGPISNEVVNFRIGDDIYPVVSDVNGKAEFNFTDYYSNINEYDVTVSFDGYDNIHSISKDVSVLIVPINKFDSVLNVSDLYAYKGENAYLIVSLSDFRGSLANKPIKIVINGNVEEFRTDSEGSVSLNVKNFLTECGKYDVTVNFEGDDFDKPISEEIQVTIDKYQPIFNVNNLSFEFNNDGFLVVSLSDSRGQLPNRILNFEIGGAKYNLSTDSQGMAELNIKDYITEPGEHIINVTFDGEELVNSGSKDLHISYKYLPILDVDDLSIVKGDEGRLSVVLSNGIGLLSGSTIIFHVNGSDKSMPTSSDGIASLRVTNYFSDFGRYEIGVSFNGDEVNFPVSKNITVSINEYKGNLTVNQIGKYYDDTFLMFNLTNLRTNEAIFNASIQVRFSTGETVVLTTDLDGLANYSLSFAPNNYSFEAKVIDSNADVNKVVSNFEIKERRGIIEITQNGTGYNNADLIVKLSNEDDVFRNIQINILFIDTGDSDELITNDDGIAVYHIPVVPGSYHILVYVSGDYTYFDNVEKDIVIDKSDADVIFSSDEILFEYNKTGHVNLTVVGGIVDEVSVVGYPNTAILNGNMVRISGLKVGHYILNVTVNPDSYHNSVSKTINVSVVKAASSVSGDDIVFYYESSGSTTLDVVGGSANSVCVAGHPDANVTLNGNVVTVSGLNVGNYTLQIITAPDGNHNSVVDESIKITVNRIDSCVVGEDIVFDYDGFGSTVLSVVGGSVGSVCVVDNPYANVTLNGNVVTVSGLNAGTYKLQISTVPDGNHNPIVDENIKITVNRIDSRVSGEDIVFDYDGFGSTVLSVVGGSVGIVRVVDHPDANVTLNDNRVTVSGLSAGNYKLQVITDPDDSHISVTGFVNITVNKIYSGINGGNIIFDWGTSGNTVLNVVGGSIGTVNIVGHPEVKPVLSGNRVTVSGLSAGNYKLQVITDPDDSHISVTGFVNITVNKVVSTVGGEDIVFDYDGFGSTVLSVVGGSVGSVSVANHPEIKPALYGNVVTVSGLSAGTYKLQVITNPDSNHTSIINKDIKITVNKIDSGVSGEDIVFDYGSSGSTTLNVIGSSISNVTVSGQKKANVTLEGNMVTVSGLDVGKYRLQVITASNQNYNSVTRFINVEVNKVDADFNFGSNGISFESDSYGYIEIRDIVGGKIVLSNISVVGYSDAVISYDDDSRVVTVSNLEANTYYLSVTIIPDANHNPVTKATKMIVTKSSSYNPTVLFPSTIRISPIVCYYGTSGSTTITNLNGATVKQANISVEGHPEIKPKLTGSKITVSGLKVGTYNLIVKTTPYEGYYSVTETVSITVKKVPAVLKASAWSDYLKSKKVWKIKLTNSKTKKSLANMQIVLKVYKGGKLEKTLKRKTNSKGEVSLKPSSWGAGKRTVKISFSKTGYSCKTIKKSVNVLKPIKLKYTFKVDYHDDGATLHIYVKAGKKPVNNVKVKLKVPKRKKPLSLTTGKYYNKKKKRTDVGYVAYGTNMLPSGKYTFKIEPISLKYTGSKTKTITIKVKKGANKNPKSETIVDKGKRKELYK